MPVMISVRIFGNQFIEKVNYTRKLRQIVLIISGTLLSALSKKWRCSFFLFPVRRL